MNKTFTAPGTSFSHYDVGAVLSIGPRPTFRLWGLDFFIRLWPPRLAIRRHITNEFVITSVDSDTTVSLDVPTATEELECLLKKTRRP